MKRTRKKIYVALSGGFGPLAQVLPTIEKLREEDLQIICSSTSKAGTELLKKLGYEVLEFPTVSPPKKIIPKGSKWWDLDHYWGRQGYLDDEYVRTLVISRTEMIRGFNPDLIISMFNPPASLVARILNVPLVSFTQSCMHPNGKRVSWWEEPNEAYERSSVAVNRVLVEHGLPVIEKMEDLNKGDLTIIASFPEFDPVSDSATVYIGPSTWDANETSVQAIQNDVREGNSPIIYVYTGHMHDTSGPSGITIIKHVIEAFDGTEFEVRISTGMGQDSVPELSYGRNVSVQEWVPSSQIKASRLMIHHGGHGSCMSSLLNGIPSLIIPTFSEREFNSRQMDALGVGDWIPPNELNPDRLFEVTRNLMSNGDLYSRSKKWSAELERRNYGGSALAKKLIMNMF